MNNKLRVLMYHKVHETEQDFLTVNVSTLKKQIDYILKRYTPIRLSELKEHILNGKELPEKPVLISFDDGYVSNYTLAWPLLKDAGIPFCIFPVAGFAAKSIEYDGKIQSFMSPAQLVEMNPQVEYGYHGFKHLNFNTLNIKTIEEEVKQATDWFKNSSIPVQPFWAYTYGAFPKGDSERFESIQKLFADYGIIAAFRIGNRFNSLPLKDVYRIERLDIRGNDKFLKFKLKLRFGRLI
jgi:peptidoglycan/xylan/chitin deacetylase (PgdA/CDA1 family)